MFNSNSSNTIITFYGGTRGNFVRCCLTLAPDTADASFKNSSTDDRLRIYKDTVIKTPTIISNPPWGPCHMDNHVNYDNERINNADYNGKYIHCGHLHQIPQSNNIENTLLSNKKFINISLSESEIHNLLINPDMHVDNDAEEIYNHANGSYLNKFFNSKKFHNIPHEDIIVKDKFLEHCYTIDSECFIDKISEYYDVY